jgi:hypothetical protein
MFTKLYLDTTNPKLTFSQMWKPDILFPMVFSIIFHTILYILFCNMVSWIFFGKIISTGINNRLILFLLPVMFFGFIGRFFHVKDVYEAYNKNIEKTRNHLDKLYISWIFIS